MMLLIFSLINISSLIFIENMGGTLLFLPFNSLVIFFVILFVLIQFFFSKSVSIHSFYLVVLASYLLMIFSSLLAGVDEPLGWLLRTGYIFIGLLLLFSLLQDVGFSRANYIKLILFTLAAHAAIGCFQVFVPVALSNFIPVNEQGTPDGIFQQVNVMASLMVTGISLAIYFIAQPEFRQLNISNSRFNISVKYLPFLVVFLATFVVFSSGSRAGLLGFFISTPFILIAQYKFIHARKRIALAIYLSLVVGMAGGIMLSDGFYQAHSKIEKLAEGGKDLRPVIYRTSWELFKDSPIIGHGIGSFSRVFHEKVAEKQELLGGKDIIGSVRYTHPHNELLFWTVEGGILSVLGILVAIGVILYAIIRQGVLKGLTYFSLLFPISLHTMVEFPFYLSAYHWFIFIFIISLLFRESACSFKYTLSQSIIWLIKSASIVILCISLVFFGGSFYISQKLPKIIYGGEGSLAELYAFRQHPYFTDFSVRLTYANLAVNERELGEVKINKQFAEWLEAYLQRVPDINVFIDLMRVYKYLNDFDKLKSTIDRALYLYPENELINSIVNELNIPASS